MNNKLKRKSQLLANEIVSAIIGITNGCSGDHGEIVNNLQKHIVNIIEAALSEELVNNRKQERRKLSSSTPCVHPKGVAGNCRRGHYDRRRGLTKKCFRYQK